MPYIDQAARLELDVFVNGVVRELRQRGFVKGEINYVITRVVNGALGFAYGYEHINDLVGVLECAKLELYRRIASDYEDMKLVRNGEVYGA